MREQNHKRKRINVVNSETGGDGIRGLDGGDQPSDKQKDISSAGRKGRKTTYRSEKLPS